MASISRRRGRWGLLAASLVVLGASCSSSPDSVQPTRARAGIVIASFDFPESVVLADIYAGALRAGGYRVSVLPEVGPREIVDPALSRGLVDMVPEYAGSALLFFSLGTATGGAAPETTLRALGRTVAPHGLVALSPARAQNANTIVVTRETADRFDLRTVSDLATVAGRLTFGGPAECPQRPLCLGGLRDVYGLSFREFVPLDTGGPLTLQALATGEIDVGLLFTTDPAISAEHLVALKDDRALQPAENITPVLRRSVLAHYGSDLEDLIDGVSARLATDDVRALNRRAALGQQPGEIAATWLAAQGIG